jgi:hypothetical protein
MGPQGHFIKDFERKNILLVKKDILLNCPLLLAHESGLEEAHFQFQFQFSPKILRKLLHSTLAADK